MSIDVLNISEGENFITFDFETSIGQKFYNLKLNTNESYSQKLACPLCIPIIGALIDIAVDALTESTLEQCTNAMNALNCENANP